MGDPVRVVIFGNGFARSVMLPALRHVEGAEVVGIASPNQERLQQTAEEFGIPRFGPDHRSMLESCAPDLAIVATPPFRHLDQSRDAFEAGCHVICEKPTALDAEESAAMAALAAAHPDRLALIDHELRFDPKRQRLRALLAQGAIGRVLRVSYAVTSGSRRDPKVAWNWLSDAALGGGALGALGSHAVDSLRALVGTKHGEVKIDSVGGRTWTAWDERSDADGARRPVTADDAAELQFEFESGLPGSVLVSQIDGVRTHRMHVAGESGSITWSEKQPLAWERGGKVERVEVEDELPSSAQLKIPDTEWARCFLRLARAAVASIEEGASTVDGAATFADGHANQQVIDAVRAGSARESR